MKSKRIFSRVAPADFVGRDEELDVLLSHAKSGPSARRIVVLAAPRAGASELLRQAYDRLFFEQDAVTPFYFEIKAADRDARVVAHRFAHEFLLQTVAFRRRRPDIQAVSPSLDEIAELAAPADGYWIDRALEALGKPHDSPSFVRNCLGTPLRAALNGSPSLVMIDDVQIARQIDGGFLEDLFEVLTDSPLPIVFSGRRRFLFGKLQAEIVDLEPLGFAEAGKLVEKLALRSGVAINEQTRDLIAVQLGGNAGHTASLVSSAAANGDEIGNFDDVERVYTDEIFGGHIGRHFDRILDATGVRSNTLKLLAKNLDGKLPVDYWRRHSGLSEVQFAAAMETLHHSELINHSSGSVTVADDDVVLRDYIRSRVRLEIAGEQRALAVGTAHTENAARAPALMSRIYRANAAIGLRELMLAFDGRQVSPALLDYTKFKNELKGAGPDKIQKALKDDNRRTRLPQIVYTANTAAFYPPIGELCDIERSAVGLGFPDGARRGEIAWLAAEIQSKLEAERDVAEFWCDRLEMAAMNCGFANFKMWLIAPEGFSPGAMTLLKERNAFGSSRPQVELLAAMLHAEIVPPERASGAEYDFVVPMGGDAEMFIANAVDDIGKRHDFPAKAINQIKTALVEVCINASEHSLSPDGKIRQKFVVDDDKMTITVTNRGVRLVDRGPESTTDEGRRGWGLRLIKGLMDTIEVQHTDDGTEITMTKRRKSG